MTQRLAKEPCSGAGRDVVLTGEEAQFRSLTCPVCNRRGLGALNVREADGGDWDEIGAESGDDVGTVPPHRAKVTMARGMGLDGPRPVAAEVNPGRGGAA